MDKKTFELRVLGPTELVGLEDGAGELLARQPKRLALLSYLALTTAAGFRRRDEVIGLFWPELEQAQARTYLRKALHAIRDDLGASVFLSRGDDELRIDHRILRCDAASLLDHFRAGRNREALALYRGELLAGLFPEGVAQEFEEWLRAERNSLRHHAARAAWECVKEEERRGDTAAAAVLARRALEIEPDNEEGVRRLMGLLDKRGDRAAALRVYADWQVHLKAEFDVEPDPETRRLARHVQAARKGESRETRPSQPAPRNFVSEELVPATLSIPGGLPVPGAVAPGTHGYRAALIAAVAIAIVTVAATMVRPFASEPGTRSVSVLPLKILGDDELMHVSAAIVEELTTTLTLDSSLSVHSAIPGQGPGAVTAHLVDGAVQAGNDRIRVTLRLLRAADAEVLWAGSFDLEAEERQLLGRTVAEEAGPMIRAAIAASTR